jgi:hypothetical protein
MPATVVLFSGSMTKWEKGWRLAAVSHCATGWPADSASPRIQLWLLLLIPLLGVRPCNYGLRTLSASNLDVDPMGFDGKSSGSWRVFFGWDNNNKRRDLYGIEVLVDSMRQGRQNGGMPPGILRLGALLEGPTSVQDVHDLHAGACRARSDCSLCTGGPSLPIKGMQPICRRRGD